MVVVGIVLMLAVPEGAGGQWTSRSARGALVGAGAGVAIGFGVASATDYPLKEGGAAVVVFAGGVLGAVHGRKLAMSWGEPWRVPGRLHVSLPLGWARSESADDVVRAMAASGLRAEDAHHSLVPVVTALWDVAGPLRIGAELSGVRGVDALAVHQWGRVSESVDGRVVSGIVGFGIRPSEGRRLVYSMGLGADYYAVEALAYFDQRQDSGLPPHASQPNRSASAEASRWGVHARLSLERYLTSDVSLQFTVLRRWAEDILVPGIQIEDGTGTPVFEHPEHRVSLSAWRVDLGFGLRY
jgi:hypothetical protein